MHVTDQAMSGKAASRAALLIMKRYGLSWGDAVRLTGNADEDPSDSYK